MPVYRYRVLRGEVKSLWKLRTAGDAGRSLLSSGHDSVRILKHSDRSRRNTHQPNWPLEYQVASTHRAAMIGMNAIGGKLLEPGLRPRYFSYLFTKNHSELAHPIPAPIEQGCYLFGDMQVELLFPIPLSCSPLASSATQTAKPTSLYPLAHMRYLHGAYRSLALPINLCCWCKYRF